ncbi:MAG: carbohydrate kinase family protein [Anaerolineaceae bacterium]|nr:carbohydrate kinase family protein [Anaerolineaceae bacterium]
MDLLKPCNKSAVVAGHLCVDIIPDMSMIPDGAFFGLFQPGRLIEVGTAMFSTGGAASNTGLSMFRLGVPTHLMAKIGQDALGEVAQSIVNSYDAGLKEFMIVDESASTSYTVIVNPPGVDRIFLHSPGANDSFTADDLKFDVIRDSQLFHFGYPQLMKQMYIEDGVYLTELYRRVKETGVTTSLDVSFPDPSAPMGKADWRKILGNTLPYVDLFLPSIEEILFMLMRSTYDELMAKPGGILGNLTPDLLLAVGDEIISMGVKIALVKLGDQGLFLRTASEAQLEDMGCARPQDTVLWADRALWAPCFKVKVVGTTGAGDATIAGFLSSFLRELAPEAAITMAAAIGASNVEAADALSGVRDWESTAKRILSGWERASLTLCDAHWEWDDSWKVWRFS